MCGVGVVSGLRSFRLYFRPLPVSWGSVKMSGGSDVMPPGGATHVKVFSGRDRATLYSFFAFDTSARDGVFVAAGDLNGDGLAEVVAGVGQGPAEVRTVIADGAVRNATRSLFPYGAGFGNGVRVAIADRNADGRLDIVTGAGPGGAPHVKVFDGLSLDELDSFFAYEPTVTGGVFVG